MIKRLMKLLFMGGSSEKSYQELCVITKCLLKLRVYKIIVKLPCFTYLSVAIHMSYIWHLSPCKSHVGIILYYQIIRNQASSEPD